MAAAAVRAIPPGPKRLVPATELYLFRRAPIRFLMRMSREYGDVVYFKLGAQPTYLLNRPEYVQDVLVTKRRSFIKGRVLQQAKVLLGEGLLTSEGEHHLRQRRLVQPAFHRERMAAYASVMTEYALRTRERWEDGTTLDVAHEMMQLTLAIAGKTLFDADVESEADEIGEALTSVFSYFGLVLLPFADRFIELPLPIAQRFHKARSGLDETVYRMIAARRTSGEDRGDLLSMLLLGSGEDGEAMTDEQVRDEVLTFFLAGHETTANALTWTWYLLSQHPEVEAKLHGELDAALGGGPPTADDLPQLPYARMVLAEALRLYPPGWSLGRLAVEDVEVAGYPIPRGSLVLMSQYLIHRDPRYWPHPRRFDPDRWSPETQAARPRYAYFPFSGGPRQCIGEGFAWTEGVLLLATIAQRWRLRLVPGHPVRLLPRITLRARHGMRMTVSRRPN